MQEHPLSPHLQIYRLPLTAIFSITHRLTSVVLSAGVIALVGVLFIASTSFPTYEIIHDLFSLWWMQTLLFLWIYALYFHLCHGVRHLIWDVGIGFSRSANNISNILTVVISVMLTMATCWAAN